MRKRPSAQWGRDSSVAEMAAIRVRVALSLSLQWGRDSSVAEMSVETADGSRATVL